MGGKRSFTEQSGATGSDWVPDTISEETLNDSDKSFAVPVDVCRQIFWIWVEFTSTAVAGNRQLVIEVQDVAADVIGQWARAAIVQPASVARNYLFAPAVADLSAWRDTDYLTTPIPPPAFLKATDILRVYDNNAVDAAADDMIVHIQYADKALS